MGRASRWLRSLFSKHNHHRNGDEDRRSHTSTKPKWITAILKSCKDNRAAAGYVVVASGRNERTDMERIARDEDGSASKSSDGYAKVVLDWSHAEAVAAASATAAEAAVAAAHAAVEVVRLQRIRRSDPDPPRRAAVVIQSVYRGYLARRALRALRALVRLQALVRGHIVRKRAVEQQVLRTHALIRAQAIARSNRAPVPASSHSSSKTSHSCILDPPSPEISQYPTRAQKSGYGHGFEQTAKIKLSAAKLNSGRSSSRRFDEKKIIKTVEAVDCPKQYTSSKNPHSLSNPYRTGSIPYSSEDLYLQYCSEIDQHSFHTADDSPRFIHTGSSRSSSARRGGGPSAQASVDYSESYLCAYPDHPNYMAYTKSSRAKLRSLSAPKQRTQLERSTSLKCYSTHDNGSRRLSTSRAS
uniref:DUF4005 domain-containing protein n=1 Tax=Kalanchoe fedtschenkoi TaxID=63787 RepID=A0A7N0U140_KALFE